MKKTNAVLSILFTLYACIGASQAQLLSGYVFLDLNENGIYDSADKPLSQVSISNGQDIVQSDDGGKYEISLLENGLIFLIKPSGYIPASTRENILNYFSFNKPDGSPELKYPGIPKIILTQPFNFPLYPSPNENKFKIALLGDTQVENEEHVSHVAKLVAEQLIDEKLDFVIPLGDLVFDDLDLFDPLKRVLGKIGSPVYYVYGNHDRNYDATDLKYRDETYKANFGPSWYAYNYGDHAFLVLNNVFPENGTRKFEAKIDDLQLKFIANFIKTVPSAHSIHLFMHIPLEELTNRDALFQILKDHANVYAYAGHTHTQYFKNFGESEGWLNEKPLSELVAGAVCGAWWLGNKDIYGVPVSMMGDGTPKGYWIMDVDGSSRTLTYRVSGHSTNKHMHIWTPPVAGEQEFKLDSNCIIVNVFAGTDSTDVNLKIEGGDWIKMDKVLEPDPFYTSQIVAMEQQADAGVKMPYYREKFPISHHLWKTKVPSMLEPGVYTLIVRVNDKIGLKAESNALLFIK